MRTIWKYKLPDVGTGQFVLDMPKGSHVLRVAVQYGHPCIWVLVDSSQPTVPRRFAIVGTGHPAPSADEAFWLGSFHLFGDNFVGHLFTDWENSHVPDIPIVEGETP